MRIAAQWVRTVIEIVVDTIASLHDQDRFLPSN